MENVKNLEKKLFFFGRAGIDDPGAWAKMTTITEALEIVRARNESFNSEVKKLFDGMNNLMFAQFRCWIQSLVEGQAGAATFRIECHEGDQTDIFIWGEDFPGFQGDDYGLQKRSPI